VNDGTDTSFFTENYLRTTAVRASSDALRQLVEKKRFGDKVYLVSSAERKCRRRPCHWLEHHRFYDITGIERSHVRFCRERHEKAPICQGLGITHFVE